MQHSLRIVCLSMLMLATQAFAWWETPHMLVAQIAYDHMTPEARQRADQLIAIHAKQYPKTNDFVTASVWADDIRAQGNHSYSSWHYVTLTFKEFSDPLPTREKFPEKFQVAWAVNEEVRILQSPESTEEEKGLALRRLIHWVGDIHQPLHATTHVAPQYPKGDSGGNLFLVGLPKPLNNLHSLWDSGLDHWIDLDRPLSSDGKSQLSREAKRLVSTYGRQDLGNRDPYDWAINSHELARLYAYSDLAYKGVPTGDYMARGERLTDIQVTLAGQRLAQVLNAVFCESSL